MKNMKRIVSIALVLVLGLGVFSVAAGAMYGTDGTVDFPVDRSEGNRDIEAWLEIMDAIGAENIMSIIMQAVVDYGDIVPFPNLPQEVMDAVIAGLIAALPDDAPDGLAEHIDSELAAFLIEGLFTLPQWPAPPLWLRIIDWVLYPFSVMRRFFGIQ